MSTRPPVAQPHDATGGRVTGSPAGTRAAAGPGQSAAAHPADTSRTTRVAVLEERNAWLRARCTRQEVELAALRARVAELELALELAATHQQNCT